MAVKIKKGLVEGQGHHDESFEDQNTVYDVLVAMANTQNDLVAQFNQLKADHDSSTAPTTATDVVAGVEVE